MKISVVILSWNGREYLPACLDALLAQAYPDFGGIVVDNGSTDGSAELVAERYPQVQLIRNRRNLGFAAGNNVGLRVAAGDLLVLLNQDTQVRPDWLAALARTFDDPTIGIAGCKLLCPDGTIQHAGGYLYGLRGESEHLGRHEPDDGRFDQLADVEFVSGAALAVRRKAWMQIGSLDEGFAPAYYEDVDWCYRARAAGWRVVYVPQAVVVHHESTAADPASHARQFAVHQGRLRFLLKHRPLDWLLHEFGRTERSWAATMDRSEELMAARRAYLTTLLALPGILAFRGGTPAAADSLVGLLTDLRAAAIASLVALQARPTLAPVACEPPPWAFAAQASASGPTPGTPETASAVQEQPAARRASWPSRATARLRRLRRAISYLDVLPDLVTQAQQHDQTLGQHGQALEQHGQALEQHGQALEQHGELLGWLSRRADQFDAQSTEHGHLLQGQLRDVAENIREIDVLAGCLVRSEPQLPDCARPQEGSGN